MKRLALTMSATPLLAVSLLASALLLFLAPANGAFAEEILPVERLQPLPLSFWVSLDSQSNAAAVRSAYLRGFFEATHVWAVTKPSQPSAPHKFLRLVQGVNLIQASNLLLRVYNEHPDMREKLTLSEALTSCLIRARAGLPLLEEEGTAGKTPPPPPAPPQNTP
ncbi:MAG: hypothetical protein V2A77_10315 [Pseudomonadota bacterium]